jgi:hypothetical protein
MKKFIYIILSLLLLALIVFFYFKITKTNPGENSENKSPNNPGTESSPVVTKSEKISTPEGEIDLTNVYKNKIPGTEFSMSFAFKKTSDYSMEYFFKEKFFLIVLLNENLEAARKNAETDFLAITGANQKQACYLKVEMTVPYFVDNQASGFDYGLSFCTDGKPLPK